MELNPDLSEDASPVRVSVLLPVGPNAPWLSQTLASLKVQTFPSWELVIVLDGNPAANKAIVEAADLLVPVIIIEHETSQGIARSLNAALHHARGDLMARIDADDIAYPQRLALQVAAFDADAELVLLGTSANVIDSDGHPSAPDRIVPVGDASLKRRLLSRNSFIHPSVMFRRDIEVLLGGYNVHSIRTEDYEFWLRFALCGKIDNLAEPLLKYRVHQGQHTSGKVALSSEESAALRQVKLSLAEELGASKLAVRVTHLLWIWNRSPHWYVPSKKK